MAMPNRSGAASGIDETKRTGQIGLGRRLVDEIQCFADRFDASLLNGIGVKEGTVQRAGQRRRAILLLENVPDLILRILGELVEGTITGTVVGQTIRVDPRAVDVTEQVGGRLDDG